MSYPERNYKFSKEIMRDAGVANFTDKDELCEGI